MPSSGRTHGPPDSLKPGTLEFGLGIHAYGDSFAHRDLETGTYMYSPVLGHSVEKAHHIDPHNPDKIEMRRPLYKDYGSQLYKLLSAMSARKAWVDTDQFSTDRAIAHGEIVPFVDVRRRNGAGAFALVLPMQVHQARKRIEVTLQQQVAALKSHRLGAVKILEHLFVTRF